MVIDHIGIVVGSLEKGIEDWERTFGYGQMTDIVVNTRQGVRVVFLAKRDSLPVKLIQPVDEDSPAFGLARKGGGLHHLCFKTRDMKDEIRRLRDLGMRVIAGPEPGEAFENENIAFLSAKQGLNIELIDTDKRAGRHPLD